MASSPGNTYLMPRSTGEITRLNTQHRSLLNCMGSFAHPSLGDLSQFHYILDSATGTTVWAEDALNGGAEGIKINLAEDVVVEAADVSDKQFPPLEKRHPRLGDVFVLDILKPFPESKSNRYDLIHQRFLVAAFTGDEWPVSLRNLLGGLVPGGYLSLSELSTPMHQKGVDDKNLPHALKIVDELTNLAYKSMRKITNLVDILPALMEEAGFVDVQSVERTWWMGGGPNVAHFGPNYAEDTCQVVTAFWRALLPVGIQHGGVEGCRSSEDLEGLLMEAVQEIRKEALYFKLVMAVGRKPI